MTIIAAADGSALGNPGPAGWGWYIDSDRWACGGWKRGTNNQGELVAVLDLLRQTRDLDEPLEILCDSQYVINSVTKWMHGWKRKGWKKADGKPVLNVEIMRALDAELAAAKSSGREVSFRWVKGHAGHELNEKADRLANGAAQSYAGGSSPDSGPGFPGASASAGKGTDPADAAKDSGMTPDVASPRTSALSRSSARGTTADDDSPSLFDLPSGDEPATTAAAPSAAVGPAAADAVSSVRQTRSAWHSGGAAPLHADFRKIGEPSLHGEEAHAWAAGRSCVMVSREDGALEVWVLEGKSWELATLAAGA
ncbi:ribonuclease H family protein [Dietzia timorensis]|uniref:ribonuclease H family protein n=1 Tax=Dietzia timorensis TaxID=499555 RepID=UPI0009ED482A|nr:ribonuclease H [Dietzia timorensis]